MSKNILITGGAGYIGSVLATRLVRDGHNVTVVDKLVYEKKSLNHLFSYKNFQLINADVLNFDKIKKYIKKNEFIIPLAALVGAPLCEKNKKLAYHLNYNIIKKIINNLKKNQKIIFPTTNSGYGIGEKNKYCDENTPLNPISVYGTTKSLAEKEVMLFKNSISFRLATVFGFSYRMRSDLIVNNFVLEALTKKKLFIFEPYFRRNFIHVLDVVEAFCFAMKNFSQLKGNIYNLGLSSANITKLQLAKKVKKVLPKCKIFIKQDQKDPDQRDYFVSNAKIEKKGFKAKISLESGIKELSQVFLYDKKIINNY